jgi:hypothetical protein
MSRMEVWCMGGISELRMGVVDVVFAHLRSVRHYPVSYVSVCLYRVCVNGWGSVRLYPVAYVCVCLYRVYPSVFTPVCVCVLASVGS